MIQLDKLVLRRGGEVLIDSASLSLHGGWKTGLTGRNGCGKSSLLALLRGDLEPDRGDLQVPGDWRIAHMDQEIPALECSALTFVLDGNQPLRAAEAALARAEATADGDAIARAHAQLDNLDAWRQPARAATVLAGLGFSESAQHQAVAAFSGGWRMRLSLARVLLSDADLLLLDEPTNHLDLDAVLWLQDWLQKTPCSLLLISHDREFLDAVVDHVIHIEHKRATLYSGNYSAFERQRREQLAQQDALREKQAAQVAHLQQFVDRFRAKATKARQAQSRLKALARLPDIAPAHIDAGFDFRFFTPLRLPNPMIDLKCAACGYAEAAILRDVTINLRPESRIGLLGPNGAGKSTLIRTLAGELPALEGQVSRDPDLAVGYFHQQQVDALPADDTPFALLQRQHPERSEVDVRKALGQFGFHGDAVFDPVARFSGGEKSRLALALLVHRKPALLLLDEPANHLDLDMREALTLALQTFEGAVVIVSHDRHLLETTVDELVLVANGTVTDWDGDLDDYAGWLRQQRQGNNAAREETPANRPDHRAKRQQAARLREQLRPLKQAVKAQEKALEAISEKLAAIEAVLADETLYSDPGRKDELSRQLAEQGKLRQQQDEVEMALLDAMEALEAAQTSLP